jgi:hypothetical protein
MMQQGMPPQPKKGMTTLTIVLIVIGVLLVLLAGVCGLGVIAVQREAKKISDDIGDGGIALVSPPDVTAALAGSKKDYVGQWKSKRGSALRIDADGRMLLEKDEDGDGIKEKVDGPIVSFSGNDIVQKPVITITTRVSVTPHQNGDHWEMTADGIDFSR